MPKPKPKNAFYYFMIDFREEEKNKGVSYPNMAAVAEVAGPIWQASSAAIREKYKTRAEGDKSTRVKMTSTGVPVAEIKARKKKLEDDEKAEKEDIEKLVKSKHADGTLQNEDLFVMDVNSLCRSTGAGFLIGEVTLLRFSLEDGIKDWYHTIINPDNVPLAYGSDIKVSCKEYALEMPDETAKKSDYKEIMYSIIDFMMQWNPDNLVLPIIYTMPEKVPEVRDFITLLCSRVLDRHISEFRIYKLDNLLCTISKTIVTDDDDVILHFLHARAWLNKDIFMWIPRAGCKYHHRIDRSLVCTTSRAKRWAYTILDKTAGVYGPLVVGKHAPDDDLGLDDSSSGNSTAIGSMDDLLSIPESEPPVSTLGSISSVSVGRGRGRFLELMKNLSIRKEQQ